MAGNLAVHAFGRSDEKLDVVVLYNEPSLPPNHPDWASEAGVLESVEAVEQALLELGHRSRRWAVSTLDDFLAQLPRVGSPHVVVNLFEGFGGVGRGEAEVAGLLELAGHSLTGSPAETLALVRDKARTKWLLAGRGLPTADFLLLEPGEPIDSAVVAEFLTHGPAMVKPAHEDASLGISRQSIVADQPALVRQAELLRGRYGPVLVERFVIGREFNVAIIETAPGQSALLPLSEIEFSGDEPPGWQIVTYEAKWDIGSQADRSTPPRCPAQVDSHLAAEIGGAALAAFQVAGCRDYARVDMRVDAAGNVFILEINGNPDIGPTAGLARALRTAGYAYTELIEHMVLNAVARGSADAASRLAGGERPPVPTAPNATAH